MYNDSISFYDIVCVIMSSFYTDTNSCEFFKRMQMKVCTKNNKDGSFYTHDTQKMLW